MIEIKVNNQGQSTGCLICGEDIIKLVKPEEMTCLFCGDIFQAESYCTHMHYVCNECHDSSPFDIVAKMCLKYQGINPIELAVEIMNTSAIRMHGPEHHFIVPAVLLTCTHNLMGKPENLIEKLQSALEMAKDTLPNCSFNIGVCGASMGTGIFLNIFTEQDPNSEDEWSLANTIIAESLKKVAESGGPRCCKRDTYLSIEQSVEFLRDKFAIELPVSEAKCTFSLRNNGCGREECSFYNLGWSLV